MPSPIPDAPEVTSATPPGPVEKQPLRAMRQDPLGFLTGVVTTYGDLTSHVTGGETVYVLNRPDLVRHVLKDHGANYTKAGTPDDLLLTPLLGRGLLTSTGETWARQRRTCAPAFRRSEVQGFDGVMTTAARALAERWTAAAGTPVRVDRDLTSLTLEILVGSVLGSDVSGIGEGFGRAVDAANRFLGHFVPDADPVDADQDRVDFARARDFLHGIVHTVLAARRMVDDGGRGDLLAAMMAEHDGADTAEGRAELRHQVLTIVMAGHETTAKALTWTLHLLDTHPEIRQQLIEEIDRVLGGREPRATDLPDLPRCRRAVQEAMRLYPPVWLIARRAVADDVLDGYRVPAGRLVCISPYTLHRHPRYWEAPEEFRPDRFVDEPPAHLYLPFGGGPRVCIGQHFAMAEAVLVLAVLLVSVRLELVDGFRVEPEALVTLRPRDGLLMVPRPR